MYGEKGLIESRSIQFKGKFFELDFEAGEFSNESKVIWYAFTGKGIGSFNIFSTLFFPDLRDGSVEHAF